MQSAERRGISGAVLKMTALILMTVDHAAAGLLYRPLLSVPGALNESARASLIPVYRLLRGLGRPPFPLYCFLLVEGYLHTRSKGRYALRLFLFALISELPFDLCLYGSFWYPRHQNVFFELAAGIALLWLWEEIGERGWNPQLTAVLQMAAAAAFAGLATLLCFDYRYRGIALILLIYLLRFDRKLQVLGGGLFMAVWELPAVFAFFPLIFFYNGKRGFQLKYFFYVYYPLHLAVIWMLSRLLL